MTITIAGNKKEYEEGVTVETLIEKDNVENPLYVTDAVEFLYFMGGGAR